MRLKRLLLIQTGGTITMTRDPESGALKPAATSTDLVAAVPELAAVARVDAVPLFNLDSTDIRPTHWQAIAALVDAKCRDYDGVVVTHGTDTLVYTACALAFALRHPPVPVVLTGAQLPLGETPSDARANLVNACRVAALGIREVLVVFGTRVLRGARAKKMSVFDLEAFADAGGRPLGTIGLSIRLHRDPLPAGRYRFEPGFAEGVFALKLFPGLAPGTLLSLLSRDVRGVFLEGFGAGNVPSGDSSMIPEIREAAARGIPVVVGTQCVYGEADLASYRAGRLALEVGAIPAYDMTPEAAIVKLMWALARARKAEKVRDLMLRNLAGEMEHGPKG